MLPPPKKIKISTFCGQSGTPVPTIYKLTTPYIQLKSEKITFSHVPQLCTLHSAFFTLHSISAPLRHALRATSPCTVEALMKFVFKTKIICNHRDKFAILRLISKAPLCKGSSAAGGEGLYYFELFLQPLRLATRATSHCIVDA